MNLDGNEQGYKYSRLWLNSYLNSIEKWTLSEYDERLNKIYERFIKIWEIPDIEIADADESEEQNIFDAESPTHKKLEYFIFENTKVEEDTVSQMYVYVMRKLYEKNTQLLISNQDIIKITRETKDFRAAQEVANGWYIESNIDSNSKFAILKKVLVLFELEDELLIQYSSNGEGKTEPNRFTVRKKYWQQLLPLFGETGLFANVSPSKDHWLSTGAGIGGLVYTLIITKSHIRIELGISTSSKDKNKSYFIHLMRNKEAIEQAFGHPLEWEELADNKMSRIKFGLHDVNLFNDKHWERMNEFFLVYLPKFETAFRPFIKHLK